MTVAELTATVVAKLPEEKARAVLEYAQYLAEKSDDEAWEQASNRAATSPKFAEAARRVESEFDQRFA